MIDEIIHGDCLAVMRGMEPGSIDAIVTDPPYGLEFMGKGWDHGVPGVPFWATALNVAKPGAYLLAFGGTRTHHRLMCAIEDAGWEIRDCLMWVYGSGFPKSLDAGKAIDKAADYRLQAAVRRAAVEAVEAAGLSLPGNSRWDWTVGEHAPGNKWWAEFQAWLPGLSDDRRERVEREIVARVQKTAGWFTSCDIYNITAPATEAAKQWDGWGTALKPAWEPIILARKPLIGTVAANVLEHGTGGLNIDGCRIAGMVPQVMQGATDHIYGGGNGLRTEPTQSNPHTGGRWPANVVHDGSEEVVGLFPQSAGQQGEIRGTEPSRPGLHCYGEYGPRAAFGKRSDAGSAARFFYCAKASGSERGDGNNHPTVKPVELMRWLCRLITPPNGLILDPFAGSGTTGVAAQLEGFRSVMIEQNAESCEIARQRIMATPLSLFAVRG